MSTDDDDEALEELREAENARLGRFGFKSNQLVWAEIRNKYWPAVLLNRAEWTSESLNSPFDSKKFWVLWIQLSRPQFSQVLSNKIFDFCTGFNEFSSSNNKTRFMRYIDLAFALLKEVYGHRLISDLVETKNLSLLSGFCLLDDSKFWDSFVTEEDGRREKVDASSELLNNGQNASSFVPKKRGRPRKVQPTCSPTNLQTCSSLVTNFGNATARKRGRPKKEKQILVAASTKKFKPTIAAAAPTKIKLSLLGRFLEEISRTKNVEKEIVDVPTKKVQQKIVAAPPILSALRKPTFDPNNFWSNLFSGSSIAGDVDTNDDSDSSVACSVNKSDDEESSDQSMFGTQSLSKPMPIVGCADGATVPSSPLTDATNAHISWQKVAAAAGLSPVVPGQIKWIDSRKFPKGVPYHSFTKSCLPVSLDGLDVYIGDMKDV